MPIYIYKNPITEEIREVFQGMNEDHVYEEGGVKFDRLYTIPATSIDGKVDISKIEGWKKYTASRKGTVGDLMDTAKEASLMREQKLGVDPVKENFYKKYSQDRNGKEHPDIIARKSRERLTKLGIELV
jgi:predicted nucleic acid-binding Zn ribbon protein